MSETVFETSLDLPLINRGKVRDIYSVDDEHMLIITSDRISAFDVILPTPIPGKGAVLTRVSNFWFNRTTNIIANHLSNIPLSEVITNKQQLKLLSNHAVIVKKMQPLPVEAIVRGYIIGSGWKDYQNTGAICGIKINQKMQLAQQFDQPLYTPSTKAEALKHDENISFDKTVELLGKDMAQQIKQVSLQLYSSAAAFAKTKGIIIADTKFEFGTDSEGNLVVIDEMLTPDSSRFWALDSYQPGSNPASFDKQYVRDYLETLEWDKKAPGPSLPDSVVSNTIKKYQEAEQKLTR